MRDVLTPLCSRNRGGCPWDLRPQDCLPTSTVSDDVAPWRAAGTWATRGTVVRERTRVAAGREPTPSVAGLARQAVKTTERGGPERGEDGGQHITGRKRHLVVDPWGWVRAVRLTSARLAEGGAAPLLLSHVTPQDLPRRVTICAEQQSHHQAREAWMAEHRTGWRIEVPARPEGRQGCTPRAKRGVIARTHAWHGRYRRNRKDDERRVASRTAMIHIRHVPLRLHRLAPCARPAFHDHKDAACSRHDVAGGFPDSLLYACSRLGIPRLSMGWLPWWRSTATWCPVAGPVPHDHAVGESQPPHAVMG